MQQNVALALIDFSDACLILASQGKKLDYKNKRVMRPVFFYKINLALKTDTTNYFIIFFCTG